MSYKTGDVLPLANSPECLKTLPVLQMVWNNLNELGNQVETGLARPERNAPPMVLAIKCLKEGTLGASLLTRTDRDSLATSVCDVGEWVSTLSTLVSDHGSGIV